MMTAQKEEIKGKMVYSKILGRSIQAWMVAQISAILEGIDTYDTRCAIDARGRVCIPPMGKAKVMRIAEIASKCLEPLGILVYAVYGECGGVVKYDLAYNVVGTSGSKFRVGLMDIHYDMHTVTKAVIECNNLYERLYRLLYDYLSECAHNKLIAVPLFYVERCTSNYLVHINNVITSRADAKHELFKELRRIDKQIELCREFNASVSSGDMCCQEFSAAVHIGFETYNYSDRNVRQPILKIDESLFYSVGIDIAARLCARLWVAKLEKIRSTCRQGYYTKLNDRKSVTLLVGTRNFKLLLDGQPRVEGEREYKTYQDYTDTLKLNRKYVLSALSELSSAPLQYDSEDEHPTVIKWFN